MPSEGTQSQEILSVCPASICGRHVRKKAKSVAASMTGNHPATPFDLFSAAWLNWAMVPFRRFE